MKSIYFVTGNKGKVRSAKMHLEKFNIDVMHKDVDIEELDIDSVEEISKDKALKAFEVVNAPVITQDTGFYILNYPNKPNFPGAFPKRELLEKMGVNGLIENMKGVASRECYFKECITYYDGREVKQFVNKIWGRISDSVSGTDKSYKWSDLWYVFIPDGLDRTLADFPDDELLDWLDSIENIWDDFSKWYTEDYKN